MAGTYPGVETDPLKKKKALQPNPSIINPYLDPEYQKNANATVMSSLQPLIRQGTNKVTSTINPFMKGQTGKALLTDVYNPATKAMADFAVGQQTKGIDYAADLPFNIADRTGNLGGVETVQGRTVSESERANLAQEALTGKSLAETNRANLMREQQTGRQLTEQERANLAREGYTEREIDQTAAGLYGYTTDASGNKNYTLAGRQEQAGITETADEKASAAKLGFANASEMNTYFADPATAKASGIYSGKDIGRLEQLVAEADRQPGYTPWQLAQEFGNLTVEQARAVVAKRRGQ